ncbi:MAG TPA: DNA ligase D [Gaiellaceae bacterium]|nr:DNA ligase D [Gaiellaceae bacterium]
MAKLSEYERKRDRAKTPEPFGSRKRGKAPIFVVQKHAARRLHYDFRLERDGVLASWAVPKGVPLEPDGRALAVHVEDHPLEYAKFAGEIPKGQYGAGTVEIWDGGTWEPIEEKRDGGLTFRLHGERLQGVWTLVPAHLDGKEQNWLLIRKAEEQGGPGREDYRPMLATLAAEVPAGEGWLHEVKWDGYRAIAYVRGGEVRLRSRRDNDLTARFRPVADALSKLPDCVLDGEVCALDREGRSSFSAMQQDAGRLVYFVFDLLEEGGAELVALPLAERRERLAKLLRTSASIQLSEAFDDGEALLAAAREQRLEGIVAKRADSRYEEGRRSRSWLKVKTHGRQEFVIAGYTKGSGRRAKSFGSLVLGVRRDGDLVWAGNVGTGFTEAEIERLLAKLRPLHRATTPFPAEPKMPRVRRGDVQWVTPKLVAEIEFSEWTHDNRLRQPSYQGLRDDKPAAEVRKEEPMAEEFVRGRKKVKLSNLDKVFWPDEQITKGDLLDYYREVAPVLVPHLRGRPFTMRRYPDGAFGKAFFQKDAPSHMPDWIETVELEVSTRESSRRRRKIRAPLVDDEAALMWMVNMGCIDMNAWYSRVDRLDRPDFVLFDLDPSEGAGFGEVVEVALLVKQALDALELESFPKTSGSKGIHVLVPVARRSTYDDTRQFAEIVAGALARAHRGLVTTEWSRAKRRGVLIDANQNGEGKTIASAYSVRPKPGATVSTPLRWDEVTGKLNPSIYSLEVVLERVRRHGDLFAGVLSTRQSLAQALKRLR